ncbi:MAG: DUF5723 family protein [Saprospiraceae bacterium]
MLRPVILIFLATLSLQGAYAQQELLLYQHAQLWHANTLNPAFFPKDKNVAIGLPALALDFEHSGALSYRDFFRKDGDRTLLDLGQAIGKLDPLNTLFLEQRTETVSLGLRLGAFSVQAGHALRSSAQLSYPRALPELLWNGNGAYIGETLDIAPSVQYIDWNEWSVGGALHFDQLSVGARVKLLSGLSALRTDAARNRASVFTSPDLYQLSLEADYAFHSAGLISAIDTSGLGFDIQLAELRSRLFTPNRGAAFDFGLSFAPNDRWAFSAGAADVGGSINWKQDAAYFRSEGRYEYEGAVIPGIDIINGASGLSFQAKLDTLNEIFQFKKTAEDFRTALPARFYVGATRRMTDRLQLGATLFHQRRNTGPATALGLSAHFTPLKWLALSGIYNVNERRAANLGAGLSLTPGPFQIYLFTDNLLKGVGLRRESAANLRAGLSLVF